MSKIPLGRPRGQMSESMLTAAFIILSGGDWTHSRRYLVPVLSFMLGIFVAECIHRRFKHMERVHWRQLILLAEIVLLFLVGFLPQWNMWQAKRPCSRSIISSTTEAPLSVS